MNLRYAAVAALAAALAVGAATAAARTTVQRASSITVWLQEDAKNNWPDVVAAATKAFQQQHPGVDVNVEYQQWTAHLQKLDAAIAGNNVPDVVEMGNTEMTKYMAAGAFADLTSKASTFENSSTWLKGLKDSATFNGKLYGVPYYAGARAVIYRKDLYAKAGIKTLPNSLAAFEIAMTRLMDTFGKSDPNFSALYFAGKNWYAGMAFVYDFGGKIAKTKGGKWLGSLEDPAAVRGLTYLKDIVIHDSRASRTTDEAHPQQALVFAKGHVASFIGNGWEWPYALDKKLGNPKLAPQLGAYPMPSHTTGQYMPEFLGGSDLAVPAASSNRDLGADWIKAFTSTESETALAKKGNIPNTTTLAGINAKNPQLAPFAEAAKSSWFVPTSPNWANVESSNVLQNMLVAIFTGKKSVQQAAKDADSQITDILNAS
jgi:N,N'-diacetylchitobiose transport system substrate-binding protein